MKYLVISLFLSFIVSFISDLNSLYAQELLTKTSLKEITFPGDEYSDNADFEFDQQNDVRNRSDDIDNIVLAKYKMINGDLKMARFYLSRINDKSTRLLFVKKRYEATLSFIEGDYTKSLSLLMDKKYLEPKFYPQVCLLKLINMIALSETKALRDEKDYCLYYTGKSSKNGQYWIDTMVKLKLKDQRGIQKNFLTDIDSIFNDEELSKLWLKSGLYINKEAEFLKYVSGLPESAYQSKRLREIIAFMYLRSGSVEDKTKALSFVDDIDSANAENIKGTINLQKKEYELAYGHFRLALSKKQDSSNALERAVPLSWILGQWSDGLKLIENGPKNSVDPRKKAAIKIAFLIREKKFEEANKELTVLKNDFKNDPPYEVSIMDSYNSLVLGEREKKFDKRKIEDSVEKSCQAFDGINCWLALQFIQWDNLGKTINREDPIFTDKELDLESLKSKKEIIPLRETSSVDQHDIEELDGESIQIIKKDTSN